MALLVADPLKHPAAEQSLTVVEGTDLAGGESALGFVEDEFGRETIFARAFR